MVQRTGTYSSGIPAMTVALDKGTYIVMTYLFGDSVSFNNGYATPSKASSVNLSKVEITSGSKVSVTNGTWKDVSDNVSIVEITGATGSINYSESTWTWGSNRYQNYCLFIKIIQ